MPYHALTHFRLRKSHSKVLLLLNVQKFGVSNMFFYIGYTFIQQGYLNGAKVTIDSVTEDVCFI